MRVLAGVTFSLGLILVIVGGAELFTGNALIVMAWASRRVTTRALLRNWLIVLGGNFLEGRGDGGMVFLGGVHHFGGGDVGVTALAIAHAKLQLSFGQAVALGIQCNALVCLAVWLSYSARTHRGPDPGHRPADQRVRRRRVRATRLRTCTSSRSGLLIAGLDPGFVAAHDLGRLAQALSWSAFLRARTCSRSRSAT